MLIWVFTVATLILLIIFLVVSFIAQIVAAPVNSQGYLDVKFKLGCFGTWLFLFGLIAVPTAIAFSTDIRPFDNRNILERATLLLLFYSGSAWLIILVRSSQGNFLRAAGNMKFSIRTLSICIVFAAIFAAMIAHLYQSRSLRLKLDQLREAAGIIASEGTTDQYVLVPIGEWSGVTLSTPSQYVIHDYSYLLQLQNHEKYSLEVGFYDGIKKNGSTTIHDLKAPQTAITYLPEFQMISVHDAKLPIESRTTLDIPDVDRSFTVSGPSFSEDPIQSDRLVLAFVFHSSNGNESSFFFRGYWSTNPTVSEMKANCDECEMKCAYFILKEREARK